MQSQAKHLYKLVTFLLSLMQLPNSFVTTEMFVLLMGQTKGRAGWRCALEECGELCAIMAGAPMMLVWCAGSWGLKWMYHGDVSFFCYVALFSDLGPD